jgi:hypothetical protein
VGEKMKKRFVASGILFLACLGGLSCDVSEEGLVIEITAEQIQKRLDRRFPISKKYLMLLKLTLADPEVTLAEGSDRIGFGLSATTNVRVNEKDVAGRAYLTARLRYKPEEGSLLLIDPEVENLTFPLLPEEYRDEVMVAASLATQEFLDDYEVYRLDQSDFKQAIAKLFLKDVVVSNGVLRITLGPGK